ncbi:MAG TPA: acetyl-CoA C-acyltransferase, partial [Gemmatimonadaceae bacterium]
MLNGKRVAIVAGVRTPFSKSGTLYRRMTAIELARGCVAELVQRSELDTSSLDGVVFGTVVPSVLAPNIAREVALLPHFPKGVQAFTV